MTKAEALKQFKSDLNEYNPSFLKSGDTVAKREEWSIYTDALCKNGDITMKQYESWSNPF